MSGRRVITEKAYALANAAAVRRMQFQNARADRVLVQPAPLTVVIEAMADDKADLFGALDAAEDEIRFLRAILRANGLPFFVGAL